MISEEQEDINIPSEEISKSVIDDLSEETMKPIHKEYRITNKLGFKRLFIKS